MKRNSETGTTRRSLGCAPASKGGFGYRLDPRRCDQACRDLGLRPPGPLSGTPSAAPPVPATPAPSPQLAPAALATCFGGDDLPHMEQVIEIANGVVAHDGPCDVLARDLRREGRCACVLDGNADAVAIDAPRPADAAAPTPVTGATQKCGGAVATGPALDPVPSERPALGDLRLIRTTVGDVAIPTPTPPTTTPVQPVDVLADATACATPTTAASGPADGSGAAV